MISNQRRNAMKENAENEKELENENPGWKAFMELRRQAQHNMQQLSADAEKAGSAGMTLAMPPEEMT